MATLASDGSRSSRIESKTKQKIANNFFRIFAVRFIFWSEPWICTSQGPRVMVGGLWLVWPDWAVFERSWLIFFTNVAQILGDFLGYFEKHRLQVKTAVATFWITFGIIWATFYFIIWSHWLSVTVSWLPTSDLDFSLFLPHLLSPFSDPLPLSFYFHFNLSF